MIFEDNKKIFEEEKLNINKRISMTFGILIITSIIAGIFSSVPVLEKPDYLTKLSSIKLQVLIAVFFQCLMAISYTWIAVLLYPIVKKYSTTAASGYFGFRLVGAGFLYVGIVSLLSLLFVSESYISAGQPEASYFHTIAELIRRARDWFNHAGMIIPWSFGGLILYCTFFKMKIVPTWLSIWGIIGSFLTLIITFLFVLDFMKITAIIYFAFNIPTAFFEITLAVFLFIKGFNIIEGD